MTGSRVRLVQIGSLTRDVVAALHANCFDDEQWGEQAVAGILAMPGTFGFIALKQDIPAGLVVGRIAADECEILSLGVCPVLRQAGLGRALLKALLDHAVGCGVRSIFLEVAEDNPAARQLYETEGFVVIGKRQGYYRRGSERAAAALVLSRATV